MPVSKRLRIVNAIADLLTDAGHVVRRDKQQPQAFECPIMLVFSGERSPVARTGRRTHCEMTVSVIGFRLANADSEVVGNAILEDIATAVEVGDPGLDSLLVTEPGGFAFAGEQIFMPEAGEGIVGAEIVYAVPHTRVDGDPESQ